MTNRKLQNDLKKRKMRIGLIKKMMIFGVVVAILMDLGRLIPAYAADTVTVTGRRMFRSA